MSKMLLCPNTEVSPNITCSANCSCHEMIWETGHFIDKEDYDLNGLEFICENLPVGHFPDFSISDLGCPIISSRLKDVFDQCRIENVEYFPVTVIERQGETAKSGYFAANIIGLIDCINLDESDIDGEEEDGEVVAIDYIDELVLKPESYGPIYRARLFRRIIVIEEPLILALSNTQLEGMKLISPDKWDGFYGEK